MTWAKIETGYLTNQKLMQLAPPAKLLHLAGILWSHDHETDGWIPEHMLPLLCAHAAASAHDAQALSSYGLWDPGPGGYWVHDFLKHQDSAVTRENEREHARERQRVRRESRRDNQVDSRRESRNREEKRREERDKEPPLPPTNGTVVDLPKRDPARLTPSECERTFNEFWEAYPRRIGKKAARSSWDRATRSATPEAILAALRAALPELSKKDAQYIPHPTTWLNQGRWEDETSKAAASAPTARCFTCRKDVAKGGGCTQGEANLDYCDRKDWVTHGQVHRVPHVDSA